MRRASSWTTDRKRSRVGGIDFVGLLAKRFGIADQGRERRAQLVARIGDEIDAHLLGGAGFAAVDEADQRGAVGERGGSHQPMPPRSAQAGQLDFAIVSACEPSNASSAAGWDHPLDRRAFDVLSRAARGRASFADERGRRRKSARLRSALRALRIQRSRNRPSAPIRAPLGARASGMRPGLPSGRARLLERRAMSKSPLARGRCRAFARRLSGGDHQPAE